MSITDDDKPNIVDTNSNDGGDGSPPTSDAAGFGDGGSDIAPVSLIDEMRRSYMDYAMSVIVSRALPDVRDGLKPVHRRILYAMKEGGYDWNRPYRKSARIVGDVMGAYHPHGDSAIYDAMVRMAQNFSLRLPLVDGQGNFGSVDGDPPAAMRYTEARLQRVGSVMLDDIGKETVDFQPNYDESELEPIVLPAPFPNLLVNGAGGIAVGMATNIPPHNLAEVIAGCKAYIENPDISIDELIDIIPGPDFPTGATILGRAGTRAAYHTGRGSVVVRAKAHIEEPRKDREAIVFTEIPYQVNKQRLIERISELGNDKTIEGMSLVRDESDREGMRIVIEIKRDAQSDIVLNQLYRYTALQSSFGCNLLAINEGRPEVLDLRKIIAAFIEFREEVVTRRTAFELREARKRAHIVVGLVVAVANIDEVIRIIRAAKDPEEARRGLIDYPWPSADIGALISLLDEPGQSGDEDGIYRLSEAQAKGILALQLQRLTGLERNKLSAELEDLAAKIRDHLDILGSRERRFSIINDELADIADAYATPRRTQIEEAEADYDIEELIPREDMVVTVSHGGYVKRVLLDTYRAQRRGGKGRAGMSTRDDDFVTQVMVCSTHTPVLFFTSAGMVYKMKVYRLPLGNPQSRGKALVNLLPLAPGESVNAFLPLPEDDSEHEGKFIVLATASGNVRRNRLSDFTNVKSNGKIAMKLDDGDHLIGVQIGDEDSDIVLATRKGKAIRFPISSVRVFAGRDSTGVRGITLSGDDDAVISQSLLKHVEASPEEREAYIRYANALRRIEEEGSSGPDLESGLSPERLAELAAREQILLTIADDGFGKRSSAYEYRVSGRGGVGITTIDLGRSKGDKKPAVAGCFPVEQSDGLMLVTDAGKLIRTNIDEIRVAGRSTRGVTVFRVAEGESIVSVASLAESPNENRSDDDSVAKSVGNEDGPPEA